MIIKGSIVALVTPFNALGAIDVECLKDLMYWHLEMGTEGLVLCGSTGEGNSLSKEEKLLVFETAYRIAKGKVSLIAATGSSNTKESVTLTKEAKEIGMDACLVVVPYYLRPTKEGCYQHFAAIAHVGLPMILYHHPGRTGVKLSSKDLQTICNLPNVIGIKDASGDISLAMELVQEIPHFSGDDSLTLAHISIGFTGAISVIGNIFPKEWKGVIDLALQGNIIKARCAFFQLYAYCQALALETNPQCVKYALSILGKCNPILRLPLLLPREENQEKIKRLLKNRSGILTH